MFASAASAGGIMNPLTMLMVISALGQGFQGYNSMKQGKEQAKLAQRQRPIDMGTSPSPPSGNYIPASMLRQYMLMGRN
jgi:hypothetical protein